MPVPSNRSPRATLKVPKSHQRKPVGGLLYIYIMGYIVYLPAPSKGSPSCNPHTLLIYIYFLSRISGLPLFRCQASFSLGRFMRWSHSKTACRRGHNHATRVGPAVDCSTRSEELLRIRSEVSSLDEKATCETSKKTRRPRRGPATRRAPGYTWILLWAEKSAGPQSGKFFRRIPKKTPET